MLVEAMLALNGLEQLVQRLAALDEAVPEEAAAVAHGLSILENLVELVPEVATAVVEKTGLLRWLLARLRAPEAGGNRQYASEILAVLLQAGDANRAAFLAAGGIDAALQAVAPFRARDPSGPEEEELLQNLVDALCAVLLLPASKPAFVAAEGGCQPASLPVCLPACLPA